MLHHICIHSMRYEILVLQCLDDVGWQQEGHMACKKLSGGVLAWLSVWSAVQTCISSYHIISEIFSAPITKRT